MFQVKALPFEESIWITIKIICPMFNAKCIEKVEKSFQNPLHYQQYTHVFFISICKINLWYPFQTSVKAFNLVIWRIQAPLQWKHGQCCYKTEQSVLLNSTVINLTNHVSRKNTNIKIMRTVLGVMKKLLSKQGMSAQEIKKGAWTGPSGCMGIGSRNRLSRGSKWSQTHSFKKESRKWTLISRRKHEK